MFDLTLHVCYLRPTFCMYCEKMCNMYTLLYIYEKRNILFRRYPNFPCRTKDHPHYSLLLSPHQGLRGRTVDKPLFNKVTKRITLAR